MLKIEALLAQSLSHWDTGVHHFVLLASETITVKGEQSCVYTVCCVWVEARLWPTVLKLIVNCE